MSLPYKNTEQKDFLLVVLNYNHEIEIAGVLNKLLAARLGIDMIVIDDASKDRSAQIAKELGFEVVAHPTNQGVGSSIRDGILIAKERGYRNVVLLSANGKTRVEDLPTVMGPVKNNQADYVTGSRFLPGGESPGLPAFRRIAIPWVSLMFAPFLGRHFSDITCGFRAYSIDWLFESGMDIRQSWLDKYEMEYYIHYFACKKKLRIVEVPVTIVYSHLKKGRRSHIKPFIGWWSMLRPIVYLSFGLRR